jgi:AraC-like DNA-binding protein
MLAVLLKRDFTGSSSAREAQAVRGSLDRVKVAVEHIARHYHERIEIGTLAELCNTSPRNFTRLFTEAFRRTPHEYLTDTRIAMACSHLLKKDTPISLVAEECGFFTITSFNRAFKERMQVSPREWRKRHRDL